MSEEQQSISQILRAAREQRGLDTDTVYRQTGISLPVLQGMENDHLDIIEPVFARMALQAYAEYLDIDAEPLIDRFNQEHGPAISPTPVSLQPVSTATTGPQLPLPHISTTLRTIGLGVSALLLLVLAISFFGGSAKPKAAQAPPPEPTPVVKSSPVQEQRKEPATEMARIATPLATPVSEAPRTVEQHDLTSTENSAQQTPQQQAPTPQQNTQAAVQETPLANTIDPAIEPMPLVSAATANSRVGIADRETDTSTDPTTNTSSNTQARLVDPAPTATPAQPTEGVDLSGSAPSTSPPIGLDRASQKPSSVAQLSPSSGLVLEVEALDSTWLYIRWDDKRTFRGIVPRGERRRFEADDHFLVLSGRAHGLHYRLNDKLLGNGQLGEATKVLRFRANSDGIEFLGPNFAPLTSDAATEQP
jgi:cytoskeletal protein RodZ